MSMVRPNWKKQAARWLPGLLISAMAVYAIAHFTRGQHIGEALKTVKIGYVLLLIFLTLLSLIARSIAWRAILGNKITLVNSFFGICEGYFLNNIFPLRVGELGRALFVGRSSGLGTLHVLSTILIERAFDIVFAASIILLTLPMVVGSEWIKPIAFSAFVVILVGLVILFLISVKRQKFKTWIESKEVRIGFIKNRVLPQVSKILDGLSALVHPGQFLLSVFWIGITWLLWVLLYYWTIAQLAPSAPLWWGAFTSGLIALGVAIPSAPASVGVYEATILGAFALLGISSGSAVAYAIVLHLVQIFVTAVFGLWGMARDGQKLSTLLDSLVNKKNVENPTG